MADYNDLVELKRHAMTLRRKHDQSVGALQQAKKVLRDKYGCTTIKQAKQKLKRFKADARTAKTSFDEAVTLFKDKWGDRMDCDNDEHDEEE